MIKSQAKVEKTVFGFGSISVLTSLGVSDGQGISRELTKTE